MPSPRDASRPAGRPAAPPVAAPSGRGAGPGSPGGKARRRQGRPAWRAALLALPLLAACEEETAPAHLRLAGADAARGRAIITERGCGSCHVIPGVRGAVAWVGPPLMEWSRRAYVGGRLPNAPENLVAWLRDPQAISPGSAMPSLGLTEAEARDAAAYLYTLGRAQPVPAGMVLGPREGGPRPGPLLRPRGDQ